MCNAYNHPPGCTCGWGGDGHLGRSPGGISPRYHRPQGRSSSRSGYVQKSAFRGFVNPNALCPVCKTRVFYYESPDGGRVFFDELGPPWPKHPCTDITLIRHGAHKPTSRAMLTPSLRMRAGGGSEQHVLPDFTSNAQGWHLFNCTAYQRLGSWTVLTGQLSGTATNVVVLVDSETDLHDRLLLARESDSGSGLLDLSSVSIAEGVVSPIEWEGYSPEDWAERQWGNVPGAAELVEWFLQAENLPKSAFTLDRPNRIGMRPYISDPHAWYQERLQQVARGPQALTQDAVSDLLGRLRALRRHVDR